MRLTVFLDYSLSSLSAAALLTGHAAAQGYRIQEAENSQITCEAGTDTEANLWASGGAVTPPFWGRAEGDTCLWAVPLSTSAEELCLGVRYAYAHESYVNFAHAENPERTLELRIDGEPVGQISVPDTGSWDLFETAVIDLPALAAGRHIFELVSTAPHSNANLDCFTLIRGEMESLPVSLRRTHIADSESGHFFIRTSAGVEEAFSPDTILEEFDRIWDHFEAFIGWTPPTPVGIHVIEDARWPNLGASSFQNQWGVFFPESSFLTDHGNWLHEMTHMFYTAHFPWWFDESTVRTLTTFDWAPALFPGRRPPEENPHWQRCREEGLAVINDPSLTVDSPDPIHYAIHERFGDRVFREFFRLCREASERGEIDFTPGRHLARDEIVRFMSQAAGEDLEELYRQWEDFETTP